MAFALDALSWFGLLSSAILCVPTFVYCVECLAGFLPRRERAPGIGPRARVAVLVPAHDEESCIAATLAGIRGQLRQDDRLLLVADNCSDGTATLALEAGAEVVERCDPDRRGKGYALEAGIRQLALDPPGYVIIIDADCGMSEGTIDSLVAGVGSTGGPIQTTYLMKAPPGDRMKSKVAEFAFLVKNRVRPLGLHRLQLPCQLTGAGMAFPWDVIRKAHLGHGEVVEDMLLGLELAQAGHAPHFCDGGLITSDFPYSLTGIDTQRRRWETGHLAMIGTAIRSLLRPSSPRTWSSLFLTLDLMVPPLSLLLALLVVVVALTGSLAAAGASVGPLLVAAANLLLFLIATTIVWFFVGRDIVPLRSLSQIPLYVFQKLHLYPKALLRRGDAEWVRTDRTRPADPTR